MKKESTATLSLLSVTDAVDHRKDTFILWMNPQADVTQTDTNSFSLSWHARDGQDMLIVPVTAEQLQGQAPIPAYKQAQLARLTASDRQQILAMNPFLAAPYYPAGQPLQPKGPRFVKLDSQKQLDGPDNPGDPLIGAGDEVSDESIRGKITGDVRSASSEFLAGIGFNLGPFQANLKVGFVIDYDYESITEQLSGTVQKFEVDLRTTTPRYHEVIDVYEDTLFRSFVFVSVGQFLPGREVVRGTVTDAQGRPVGNQRVLMHLPYGVIRTVFTNAQGVYRVFGAPLGTAEVGVNGTQRTVNIEAGKTSIQNFAVTIGKPAVFTRGMTGIPAQRQQ